MALRLGADLCGIASVKRFGDAPEGFRPTDIYSRALELEKTGVKAVPVPSDDPYEHWEPERSYGRATLSMRHAGYLAGLGVLSKNNLLVNRNFGNMIQIGAVLVDIEPAEDQLAIPRVLCVTYGGYLAAHGF